MVDEFCHISQYKLWSCKYAISFFDYFRFCSVFFRIHFFWSQNVLHNRHWHLQNNHWIHITLNAIKLNWSNILVLDSIDCGKIHFNTLQYSQSLVKNAMIFFLYIHTVILVYAIPVQDEVDEIDKPHGWKEWTKEEMNKKRNCEVSTYTFVRRSDR